MPEGPVDKEKPQAAPPADAPETTNAAFDQIIDAILNADPEVIRQH
ncbi:MAG: hypothetical protein JO122_05405 [Acetobacteraceae bacterium]|nr:hypothetical protein [Acetobacteraceae bacterium]